MPSPLTNRTPRRLHPFTTSPLCPAPSLSHRQRAAAVAAAAMGVTISQGRSWLEAAKAGDVAQLSALLHTNPKLLHYQVSRSKLLHQCNV